MELLYVCNSSFSHVLIQSSTGKHSFVGMIKAKDWSLARFEELKEKVQKFNEERAAAAAAAPAH